MNHRIEILAFAVGLALFGVGTLQAGESTPVKVSEASVGSVIALPVASILVGGSLLFGFEDQRGLLLPTLRSRLAPKWQPCISEATVLANWNSSPAREPGTTTHPYARKL